MNKQECGLFQKKDLYRRDITGSLTGTSLSVEAIELPYSGRLSCIFCFSFTFRMNNDTLNSQVLIKKNSASGTIGSDYDVERRPSMKRNRLSAVMIAILCCALILGSGNAGLADTAQSSEVQTEFPEYKSWLDTGWKWLQDTVKAGTDYLRENLPVWEKTIEQYYAEFGNDPEVQEAWETLKEGASEAGRVSKEKAEEAYNTIRDWMKENGGTISRDISEAIDRIAIAAGVDEAKLAEWHRTVEEFIAAHRNTMTESAQQAWETIKEYSSETGNAAKEKVEEAYQALSDWFESFNTEESEKAEEALEKIVET